jgi:3-methyladenine DNA glycosylase AlkD
VSTLYFVKTGEVDNTFAISSALLDDPNDLVHKATGWALRTAGGQGLLDFLDEHATTMPRTTLRYAIEKLPQDQREHYLGLKSHSPG